MLYQSTRFPSPLANLVRQAGRTTPHPRSPFPFPLPASFRFQSKPRSLCTATPTYTHQSTSFLASYRLALFASLPVAAFTLSNLNSDIRALQCASDRSYAYGSGSPVDKAASAASGEYKEAESMLNLRDLGFGTVSGICVGVFVKKGLRAVAFLLGGAFVFLQYMSSRSLININWGALTSSYDSLITSRAGPPASQGGNRVVGLWNWFIDFVGADIQSRATFVAGVMLGLRIG
ncbi:FUN14 domain-containing protein [Sporobolomyces salmoneus]|uniref:FUN14 domain-containing protein n=1 Tax=Sporobolomyces salmoneus TaxID=183962 RepID=UPI00316C4387